MNNFFIDTLTATPGNPITAYFKNGISADYTTNILSMLKSDPDIVLITDGLTGEIIFEKI